MQMVQNQDISKNGKSKDIKPYIIILLITLVLLLVSCSTGILVALIKDAPVYLNVARNLLNGKVLYSEIVDNKGPILYFMNALFLKLGGRFGMVLLEFILLYTIFLFAYKTIKLFNDNKKHQIIVLVLMGTYLLRFFTYGLACEEYALAFSMIGLYECVKYYKNDKFSIYQCFSLGILGGLCFLIRQNLIVVFAGFGIGIFIKHIIEKRYKELIKYIIFSILGFLTVALPILGYLLINDCFNDYIYYTFTLNMNANRQGIINSLLDIFFLTPVTSLLLIIYSVYLVKKLFQNKKFINLSILLTIILTIFFNSIGILVSDHYFISFIPIYLLLFCFLLNDKFKKIIKILIYISLFLIISMNLFIAIGNAYLPQMDYYIVDFIKENTSKDDKIAIIGFADQIYYLTERDSVSKHTYILSNYAFNKDDQAKILKEYFADIVNKRPKIIMMDYYTMLYGVLDYIVPEGFDNLITDNYDIVYNTIPDNLEENNSDVKGITIFIRKDN